MPSHKVYRDAVWSNRNDIKDNDFGFIFSVGIFIFYIAVLCTALLSIAGTAN
jgi:hypothetical protein